MGPNCTDTCPTDADGDVCGGHGECLWDSGAACACDVGYVGAACHLRCPQSVTGLCGAHGVCVAASATSAACTCDASLDTGFWAGNDCGACAPPYSGPTCTDQCPGVGSNGQVCSGRGACLNGQCVCDVGHCGPSCALSGAVACASYSCAGVAGGSKWGPDCQNWCPGAQTGPVCGGHGVCSAGPQGTGGCYCTPGWSGEDCTTPCPGEPVCAARGLCSAAAHGCQCLAGFAGANCSRQCPGTWPVFCAGHGRCRDGAARDGRCACDVGYAGADCSIRCPLGPGGICDGHGACNAQTGACVCEPKWDGEACADCAPGLFGPRCSLECREGVTVGRLCVCDAGWALQDCSRECIGGHRRPCSGHGACDDGRAGDGSCACDVGWQGRACDVACPGLKASGRACTGHGQCGPDAHCTCFAALETGFWSGPACDACAAGWVGTSCDRTCPFGVNSSVPCGGRGRCAPETQRCVCHAAPEVGFWADASNCTECVEGYYGMRCTSQCPGGACDACSGHGTCDGGVKGSGLCQCDDQWTGPACSQCAPGWYGLQCNASCPVGYDPQQVLGCRAEVVGFRRHEERQFGVAAGLCFRDTRTKRRLPAGGEQCTGKARPKRPRLAAKRSGIRASLLRCEPAAVTGVPSTPDPKIGCQRQQRKRERAFVFSAELVRQQIGAVH